MHSDRGLEENGEDRVILSRLVTTRLQKWSERAISQVKAAKEAEKRADVIDEKTNKSLELILPRTNHIKELESALTALVSATNSPMRPRRVQAKESEKTDSPGQTVPNQQDSPERNTINNAAEKVECNDNCNEKDKAKTTNNNKSSPGSDNVVKTAPVKGSQSPENSLNQGTLVRGSPVVNKRHVPARMTGKLGSNDCKCDEVSLNSTKCDHDEETSQSQRENCISANKTTRDKQTGTQDKMKSQDDAMAGQSKILVRPTLRKHKSDGDIMKQRMQLSLSGLDFKDASVLEFAAECLKAADLKEQQRKTSDEKSRLSTSPTGSKGTQQKHRKRPSKGDSPESTVSSSTVSPSSSQRNTPRRLSLDQSRLMQKLAEDEEADSETALANSDGQRQLQLATKKLEKLIRKTESVQRNTAEEKRYHEQRRVSDPSHGSASYREFVEGNSSKESSPKTANFLTEELVTEKTDDKVSEARNRKCLDESKREEHEKKSNTKKNSAPERDIILRSYKSLPRENIYAVEESTETGKKSLERLEMLRQDLPTRPRPKLHKFPSLPMFYTPGMGQEITEDVTEDSENRGTNTPGQLGDNLLTEDLRIVFQQDQPGEPRNIGSSCFYMAHPQGGLSAETKTGLNTLPTTAVTE